MRHFVLWSERDGREVTSCGAPAPDDVSVIAGEGEAWHELVNDSATHTLAMVGGVLAEIERVRDPAFVLMATRSATVLAAKAHLAIVLVRGCVTSIGRVQCDAAAQANLTAMAVDARNAMAIGAEWSTRWRRIDNSWTDELPAAAFLVFAAEVAAHVRAMRAIAWGHVDAAEVAPDLDALAAIDITAGYPA